MTRRTRFLVGLTLTTVATMFMACVEDYPTTPTREHSFALANLPADSIQDVPEMVAIAREVPTFAGMYFDDQGRLVIAMTDASRRVDAERLVRPQLGSHETKAGKRTGATVQVVTKSVQYSFLELARYKTVMHRAFRIRGVATLDANEKLNRVEIGLADPTVQPLVLALADSLGIPPNALTFSAAGYPRPSVDSITGPTSAVYGQTVVESGWRITLPDGECTVGPTGIRGTDGDSVFLTNSHCTSDKWGFDGDTVRQPHINATVIGWEILDPESESCNFGASECRDSDAALFTASTPIRFGKIVRTADSSNCESCQASREVDASTSSLTITSTLSYVVSDEIIHKIGKKSGWTYGAVEQTCVDFTIPGWPFDDETKCSDRVDYNSEGGDSGAPVFSVVSGTNVQLRGINFAHDPITSDAYMSNLGQIAIDLGHITYYDRGAPSVTIDGPTEVPGMGIQCSWQSNVTNGIPPYTYSWSGLLSGSGGAVSGPIYSGGTLYVTVTDFWGRQGNSSINVSVVQGPPLCE
jgi:hypothetical protein